MNKYKHESKKSPVARKKGFSSSLNPGMQQETSYIKIITHKSRKFLAVIFANFCQIVINKSILNYLTLIIIYLLFDSFI
jgi:hypothetical protein